MDQQVTTVFEAVKELHSSNKLLFERFNIQTVDSRHLDCEKKVHEVQAGVKGLKQRLSLLEDGRNLHEETIQTVKEHLKEIKENFETLNKRSVIDNVKSRPKSDIREKKCEDCKSATRNVFGGIHEPEHDQGRLQSNQTSRDIDVRAQEGADGGILCAEIVTTRIPEVVKQNVEWIRDDKAFWRQTWQQSIEQGRLQFRNQDGVHSVICLDISESMAEGNAWNEALFFLNEYLTGLEEMAALRWLNNEHVALVTFGHETKLQHPFTTNFGDIKRVVNALQLGGPSALYGGLVLSVAAAGSPDHQIVRGSALFGVTVRSKIVLITDGFPTENCLKQGPDVADSSKLGETKASILQLFGQFDGAMFCIPVGGSTNMEFLKSIVDTSSGRLLDYKAGKRLSRDYYLRTKLLDTFGELGVEPLIQGDEAGISEQDKEDMQFIQQRNKDLVSRIDFSHGERYRESNSKYLPVIGSRVRRGPDWHWDEHDSHGPGTVVGHGQNDDQVWVTWDEDGRTNAYMYGNAEYDVLIVDEPRQLEPGQTLSIGCMVKPGKDWKDTGKIYNTGIVIEILAHETAVVRWDNGDRNTYTFNGRDSCDCQEIELCLPMPFYTEGKVLEYATRASSTISENNITRKKNKNISYKRK